MQGLQEVAGAGEPARQLLRTGLGDTKPLGPIPWTESLVEWDPGEEDHPPTGAVEESVLASIPFPVVDVAAYDQPGVAVIGKAPIHGVANRPLINVQCEGRAKLWREGL